MPPLLFGDFCFAQRASLAASRQSTVFHQCSTASLGDRESRSGPCPVSNARVIAFHDIPGTSELVQLAIRCAQRSPLIRGLRVALESAIGPHEIRTSSESEGL